MSAVFRILVLVIVLFISLFVTIILFKLRGLDGQLHRQERTDVQVCSKIFFKIFVFFLFISSILNVGFAEHRREID